MDIHGVAKNGLFNIGPVLWMTALSSCERPRNKMMIAVKVIFLL